MQPFPSTSAESLEDVIGPDHLPCTSRTHGSLSDRLSGWSLLTGRCENWEKYSEHRTTISRYREGRITWVQQMWQHELFLNIQYQDPPKRVDWFSVECLRKKTNDISTGNLISNIGRRPNAHEPKEAQ